MYKILLKHLEEYEQSVSLLINHDLIFYTSNFMLEKVPIDVNNDLNSGTDDSTSSNNEKDSLSTPLGTNIYTF